LILDLDGQGIALCVGAAHPNRVIVLTLVVPADADDTGGRRPLL